MLKVMNHQKPFGITSNELRIHLKKNFQWKSFLSVQSLFFFLHVSGLELGIRISGVQEVCCNNTLKIPKIFITDLEILSI